MRVPPARVDDGDQVQRAWVAQFDRETEVMRKVFDAIGDFAANAGIALVGPPPRRLLATSMSTAARSARLHFASFESLGGRHDHYNEQFQ